MAFLVTGCGSSTGGAPSNEPPTATITQPLQDVTGIPVNPLIEVVFSTLMDPTSINEETVYLAAQSTDDVVAGTATLADDGVTVVFTTAEDLLPGEVYNMVVSTGVRDMLGNHPVQDLTSAFTVSDGARIVVPVVMPVAGAVLDSEGAQFLKTTLSSMLGATGGLPLSLEDLMALSQEEITLNNLLTAVQEMNPAAETVNDLLNTELSLGTALGLLRDNLPVGSEAIDVLESVITELESAPSEVLGTSLTLADLMTLPAETLGVDVMNMSQDDVLALATNPLALLEGLASVVDAGALVQDTVLGPVIATVTGAGGLDVVGGVLTQLPIPAEVATLVPADLQDLVNTVLATEDPTAVIDALLGGTLLEDVLGGLLGGNDLLNTLTGLLGDGDLAATLTGLLDVLPEDSGVNGVLSNLTGLLGSLGA
jgi:hypothetical protein